MSITDTHDSEAGRPWGREQVEAYEREMREWLRPVLPLMAAVDAAFLDLHFGVTVQQLPPSEIALMFGLEPYSYLAKFMRLLYDTELLASEHLLDEPPDAA